MIGVARFPDDDAACGWWHLQGGPNPYPRVSGHISCDYAIVGAGWTGLAAAHRLAVNHPNAQIAVIDAGQIGFGAAGRNSGFLYDLPFVFPADAFRGREDDGRQEISLYRSGIEHLRQFVHQHGADCGWAEIGQYHAAAGEDGERELALIATGLENLGESFRSLTQSERNNELGTDYYRGAIHTPGTVQVNPLALLRAYADGLPENVALYERSPASAIEPGAETRVVAGEGSVTASKILLTTNAFLNAFSGIRPRILPLMTFAGLTAPMERDGKPLPLGDAPWGVVPASLFGTSMRRLADNRLLVRTTYAYAPRFRASRSLREKAIRRQLLSLHRRFPEIDDFPLDWNWGGVISLFRNANGFFGEIAPRIFAATSAGMPVCIAYGQQLAEYASGNDGKDLDFVCRRSQPGTLPPQPFVGPIAQSAAAWRQFRARKEI